MAISSPLQSKVPTGSTKTIRKLQTILLNRTKVRREIFQQQTILQNRRIENERRKQREDELEAPNLVTKPRGAAGLIAGSAKGFFERLVGFLSYLTAGWIINNLPTWISMGKEFIARTQQVGKILGNFIGNTTNIFKDFTKLLGAGLTNLMKFDFSDTSGRVKTAFDDLNLSVENWGTDFENAIKLITTPLSEGIASGEDARPLGTENTNEGAYETSAPYSGSETVGGGSSDFWTLVAVAAREDGDPQGRADVAQSIYNRLASGAYSGKTIRELIIAEGQYQPTWDYPRKRGDRKPNPEWINITDAESAAKASDMSVSAIKSVASNLTNPTLQKNAVEFVQGRTDFTNYSKKNRRGQILRKSGDNYFGWDWNYSQNIVGSTPNFGTTRSQQQATPGAGQSFRPLPQGSFKGGERQRYLAPREGTRKHLGIDITESNWKRGTDPRIPVVAIRGGVVSSRDYVGGTKYDSGMVIDQDDGYSVRYLHMTPSVRPGQKVSAGQRIGRLVDLEDQTHLHIELFSGSKRLDPTSYITTIEKGGVPAAIARQQSPTPSPAQITPTGTPQNPQISQSLAPERTGPTVIVSQNPSSPPQQMMYSGGGGSSGGGSSPISDFALLNNFIKNKLLLDLAYL
jgi:murein DD-endopeptidase MepM/ murein hydrolase activator NlpD